MSWRNARIYVAGHQGLLGSSLWGLLRKERVGTLLCHARRELDLTDGRAVRDTFMRERPDILFMCAGATGGLQADRRRPAEVLHQNLAIQDNLFEAARLSGVGHLVFFGSPSIYPPMSPQPIPASAFLQGPLDGLAAPSALAKAAGVLACEAYNAQYRTPRCLSLVPASMYGPGDDFSPESSRILPAILAKLHDAQAAGHAYVSLWGSGRAVREFVHAEDVARAALHALRHEDRLPRGPLNVGSGQECSIGDLAERLARKVGFTGEILWDTSIPDGAPRQALDCAPLRALGWEPSRSLEEGMEETYQAFLAREVRGADPAGARAG